MKAKDLEPNEAGLCNLLRDVSGFAPSPYRMSSPKSESTHPIAYRREDVRTARSRFGACGPSVWQTVGCPHSAARDPPVVKAIPGKAAMAKQRRVMRSFLTLRAERFVFMGAG
jgi:hypothetical protein